ncbi:cytochrome c oxidase subunit 4 [Isoptericola cucumis]|uniref:Cytochrome c oxidase polypeptide 4 n=1 Tax=Isoptericola cucumis TaxID=1776856 RepID=A0ABQ2BBZ6_9MICO|nr:cytochrome c oxidase subunit 4 [Isoptericola cucumis]GGI12081.1 putative cytochrome c oxidase polypeptide 4 [Isoptericola cucumis]
MKIETKLFLYLAPFFVVVGVIYGFMSDFEEPVGYLGLPLVGALMAMVGAYLALTARRIDARPEDDEDGEIEQGAGDQGVYAPWSWWPLAIGAAAAVGFLGLAVGWWVLYIGFALGVIALVGWVFEFSRGQHAH